MDDALNARLDRIEALLLKLLEALAGDDEEPSPFGPERDQDAEL